MNSLGWSRREQTATTSKPSGVYGTLQKLNPFGSEGYVRLPTVESEEGPGAPLPARTRREEEEGWFARKSCVYILTTPSILHESSTGHVFIINTSSVGVFAHPGLSLEEAELGYARHRVMHCILHKESR